VKPGEYLQAKYFGDIFYDIKGLTEIHALEQVLYCFPDEKGVKTVWKNGFFEWSRCSMQGSEGCIWQMRPCRRDMAA
jgi:hypothetical protein